ncbi:hypothetical protein NMG60_11006846 [Bertholletia excelsa]
MRKTGGFRLGRKFVKVVKWKTKPRTYQNQNPSSCRVKAMSKICNWGRSLMHGAKVLCFSRSSPGYFRLEHDPVDPHQAPKGQLVVYVGEKEDDAQRYLVPLIYFNHPLFGSLLKETEKEYGFQYAGGIQIPCRVSEFENVRTRIAATGIGGGSRRWWSWKLRCLLG